MKTAIIIPNWKGLDLLKKNLSQISEVGVDEIIIVDDASKDGSIEFIRQEFPKIKVIEHIQNKGFAESVNDGISSTNADIIILLNTDVVPQKDLLKYTLPHFKDKNVFAVSFNEGKWGPALGLIYEGLVEHRPRKSDKTTESFWASGGSAAFSKSKWNQLGGFNLIYSPFYWEDIDLSYRAQKRGWEILWEPKAKVIHEHEATIGRFFTIKKKRWVVERNQILFFWLNINSSNYWLQHFLWMPRRLLKIGYWVPFMLALIKIPEVVIKRIMKTERIKTDEQIFAKFS